MSFRCPSLAGTLRRRRRAPAGAGAFECIAIAGMIAFIAFAAARTFGATLGQKAACQAETVVSLGESGDDCEPADRIGAASRRARSPILARRRSTPPSPSANASDPKPDVACLGAVTASGGCFVPCAAPPPPPPPPEAYNSGGPFRVGQRVTLPDGHGGLVIADFREVPAGAGENGKPSGRYRYDVIVPRGDLPAEDPRFESVPNGPMPGLVVVTLERKPDGSLEITNARSANTVVAEYERKVAKAHRDALAATAEGQELQRKLDELLGKLNAANERSKKKLLTERGLRILLADMALAGTTDKVKKALKTDRDVLDAFNATLIEMGKAKISNDLDLSTPGLNGDQGMTAEAVKGSVLAKMGKVPPGDRREVATKLIVEFGARAAANKDDPLAAAALDALVEVGIDYALPPVVGPLAREAADLAKQLDGYLGACGDARKADAALTRALQGWNDVLGGRQALGMIDKHRGALLKEESDKFYSKLPANEEKYLVGAIARRFQSAGKGASDMRELPAILRDFRVAEVDQAIRSERVRQQDPHGGSDFAMKDRAAAGNALRRLVRAEQLENALTEAGVTPRLGPQIERELKKP